CGNAEVWGVVEYPLDGVRLDEFIDVDRARALELDRIQLFLFEDDVAVLTPLIGLHPVFAVDCLATLSIHVAGEDAGPGFPVQGMEADLAALRGRRRQRHRAGDQG